jgi:hypothetical protein
MNIPVSDLRDEEVFAELRFGQASTEHNGPRSANRNVPPKRNKAPQRFNGIHRRRRKKIMW